MMRLRPSDWPASSGKHSSPPASVDQLRHPADAADQRLVPLLEVHARPARKAGGARAHLGKARLQLPDQRAGLRLAADHAAEGAHHAQDLGDAAVVEDVHLDAGADQLGGDVRLQVGEAEHQVGLAAR